jgi:hypothetical protein
MAEVTGLRNNALPYPIYGAPFGIVYPMLDADGDPVTGATTPDAEVSKNGDTFADCTNESTEIATNSGVYYLLLTGTELTCDVAAIIAKSATAGMKTTVATLYPRKLVTIRSGTSASGGVATSTIVLDASASSVDDYYNGMVCIATIDSNVEVRVITDYTGSTQTCTVTPDWNVAPDNNDTFVIKLPEGIQRPHVDKIYSDTTHIDSDTTHIESDAVRIESKAVQIYSDTTLFTSEGDISDILSRLTVTNSQLLIVKSDTSDIRSALVIIASDTARIESDTNTLASDLAEGDFSDIISNLTKIYSDTTAIHTQTTRIDSDQISRLTVINSQYTVLEQNTSDTESMLLLIRSDTTHIESDAVAVETIVSDIQSDTNKLVSDATEVDTSDILSLLTKVYSDTTHIHSDTTRIESDTTSLASDLAEADFSDLSSLMTKIYSDTTAIHTQTTQINSDVISQFVVIEENTSDTESMLALIRSDTAHIESDAVRIESKVVQIYSDTTAVSAEGDLSDVLSRLTVTNSQLLVVKSDTSDIVSALVKIYSDTSLATGTNSLPAQGAPGATATEREMVAYLYKAWRNKTTQTSTEYAVYDDGGSTKDHKASVSDDGTTTTRLNVGSGA